MRARWGLFAAFALAACAAHHEPPKPIEQVPLELSVIPEPTDDELLERSGQVGLSGLHASISYLGGRTRAPVVRGSVRGTPTWMLLDTGASHHFIATWIVHRIFADGEAGTVKDHVDRSLQLSRVDHPAIKIDGWGSLADVPAYLVSDHRATQDQDMGLTLSPQQLAGDGAIVLDFPNDRITRVPSRTGALGTKGAQLPEMRPCSGVYTMTASIAGRDTTLLLDTGAWMTDVRSRSSIAKKLAERAAGPTGRAGTAGGTVDFHVVPRVDVTLGAVHATVDIAVLDEPRSDAATCNIEGVIGMDVLSSCVIALDAMGGSGRCGG